MLVEEGGVFRCDRVSSERPVICAVGWLSFDLGNVPKDFGTDLCTLNGNISEYVQVCARK